MIIRAEVQLTIGDDSAAVMMLFDEGVGFACRYRF